MTNEELENEINRLNSQIEMIRSIMQSMNDVLRMQLGQIVDLKDTVNKQRDRITELETAHAFNKPGSGW